ncbi:ACP S-malonyltransferase [Marinivivus vitaminiproducens]|uniref:ACP S-malonyltransferase n=1 Tax=Marinivivus vitaminiproducens TaxID=3035935 RepID=UPI0027A9E40D|nr:ACP S-malonyltransferase [Geminicoccaceae bacterium SCSIO 64248]
MRAFLFPGQGSQAVGMGRALSDVSPAARHVFEEVDDALGSGLSRLMFEGPAETLTLTANAQPALMATSIAALRRLEEVSGRPVEAHCAYVAGHSLGEYSALAAAGAIRVADAARLLRLRGEAMQDAVPQGEGAMAALIGLDIDGVEALLGGSGVPGVCTIANDNAPGQVVISGERAAVEAVVAFAKDNGVRRCMILPVSAPFHCALMGPAAEAMRAALADLALEAPAVPVISNVTARPESDPAAIKDLLVRQVTGRVRWREGLHALQGLGVDSFVELGAGRVLAGLVKRTLPDAQALSLHTPDDIAGFLADRAA